MNIVDYNFLESKYPEVRQSIIDTMIKAFDFSHEIAVGIVDYENDNSSGYNQVKDLMEQDLIKGREFNIPSMTLAIIANDEGKYQLSPK